MSKIKPIAPAEDYLDAMRYFRERCSEQEAEVERLQREIAERQAAQQWSDVEVDRLRAALERFVRAYDNYVQQDEGGHACDAACEAARKALGPADEMPAAQPDRSEIPDWDGPK